MIKIHEERLKSSLINLAKIGKKPNGGVDRFTYSKEYYESIDYLKELMEAAHLSVEIDAVGNVIGTAKGKTDEVIMMGSHIDSVPDAGIFDGCLGVLGAVEVMRTLAESKTILNHTVKVISWAEEEGNVIRGLLGSGAYIGKMDSELPALEPKLLQYGITKEDVKKTKCRNLDKIKAYLELHIEQGGILYTKKKAVGVVTGIVGIERYIVTLHGKENHAGTTPMDLRDDAMVKAAELIVELNHLCRKIDPDMVCTTGWIEAKPGAQNVVAGEVTMSVEIRAMYEESIAELSRYMKQKFPKNVCEFQLTFIQKPVQMSMVCRNAIKKAADDLGMSSLELHSGAGHDAMMIADVVENTGMIFAPSVGGVSHCPQEWTEWEDAANCANVLMQSLLQLDKIK